jgi:hypothetical protein
MNLDYAYFAQEANWVEGLVDTIGGGWRTYLVDKYPAVFKAVLVLAVELEAWEVALVHTVGVFAFDDAYKQIALGVAINVEFPADTMRYVRVLDLSHIGFERDGDYHIEVWLDGQSAKSLSLKVQTDARALARR